VVFAAVCLVLCLCIAIAAIVRSRKSNTIPLQIAQTAPAAMPVPARAAPLAVSATTSPVISRPQPRSSAPVIGRVSRSIVPPTPAASGPTTAAYVTASEPLLPTPASSPVALEQKPSQATLPATMPAIARPPLKPIAPPKDELTDAMLEASIRRGARYLINRFPNRISENPWIIESAHDPRRGGKPGNADACGRDALAVYALMNAGLALGDSSMGPKSVFMNNAIDSLKRLPASNGNITYAVSLRLTALSLFNRPEDRNAMQQDMNTLIRPMQGGFTYFSGSDQVWDNSNSQYGLLGVWSGAEAGLEVPLEFWERVDEHWSSTQLSDGEWPYKITGMQYSGPQAPKSPYGPPRGPTMIAQGDARSTMTAAGIVSTIITHDYLDIPKFTGDVGRDPFTPALRKGLAWWEDGDNYLVVKTPIASFGYKVFGIERVGLASGFKQFGSHEWFREMAAHLIAMQNKSGAWGDDIDTSYILTFLARGRHPVLMNKLRFDTTASASNEYWANRPRDVANLARWTGRQLERPLNWQVVRLDHDWQDWSDSAILYIASHQALTFSDHDCENFRNFILAGGLIFTQADGDSLSFNTWLPEFAHRLFPQYELQDVPENHPIYSVNFRLGGRPPLKMISNGSRILLLHSPKDIARWWQSRDDKLHPDYYKFGENLFLYAGGKCDWRNKLQSILIPDPTAKPTATFPLIRVQYAGDWDPEPAAWPRFSRAFQNATGYGLDLQFSKWSQLTPGAAPIAHVTGATQYDPSPTELEAMRKYVEAGGVMLIDGCGGSGAFEQSMRAALAKAFPDSKLELLSSGHPMLNSVKPGMADLTHRKLRLTVTEANGAKTGGFEILSAGKGHVIYSALDLTSGLLGTDTWGIWGYDAGYGQSFVQNFILWTVDGQNNR
jgi:hypothetical protein